MGRQVQGRGAVVARQLGQHHSVLPVPAADPQGDLHHQRDRVVEHGHAYVHPQPTHLPERRGGIEGAVHGDPGGVKELEEHPSLEAGVAELPVDVRRGTGAAGGAVMKIGYTVGLTDPQSLLRSEVTQFSLQTHPWGFDSSPGQKKKRNVGRKARIKNE